MVKTIAELKAGKLGPIRQDDSKTTYAPMLSKAMAGINWSKPALAIHNLVRGLIPWPVATTTFHNQPLKIWRTQIPATSVIKEIMIAHPTVQEGTIISFHKSLFVACQENTWLELKEVQPPNKARLSAYDWANGIRLQSGDKFSI